MELRVRVRVKYGDDNIVRTRVAKCELIDQDEGQGEDSDFRHLLQGGCLLREQVLSEVQIATCFNFDSV